MGFKDQGNGELSEKEIQIIIIWLIETTRGKKLGEVVWLYLCDCSMSNQFILHTHHSLILYSTYMEAGWGGVVQYEWNCKCAIVELISSVCTSD